MNYDDFIARKSIEAAPVGLSVISELPGALRPFQRDIVTWGLKRGRAAVFAGTGLGKTFQQLSWADAVRRDARRPVLALAPLAVAHQTVQEAQKFNIESVEYAAHQDDARSKIVVTNYDRIDNFDPSKFSGIVLDESSIIKAHDSKTRAKLIEFTKDIPFRLPCTATPAPNDYVELGNHAEFLGVCSAKEMLATWFVHDGSLKATNVKNHGSKPVDEWRLKGHAEQEFWAWLSTWSVMLRHPRELGYDEPGYDLPALNKEFITVPSDLPVAHTLSERLRARRDSTVDRVRAAAALVNSMPDRPWLVWCNSNAESEMLTEAIHDAIEVRGSHSPELKTQRLMGFVNGSVRVLVSKPSIAGWGMNFQRCADMVFVGLNDSFEQLFQAIRRCWRFGQALPVNAWFIASTAEGAVVDNLAAKEAAAEHMAEQMSKHTRDLTTRTLRGARAPVPHQTSIIIPSWLKGAA
ncbi:DEAD/DEAH box helicase [Bradyrhizobium prioriisuperbiae]|uniref:DEAD/DEAH box helicase n=1 Tax=Bradyrhizobium prioriisuperbiae TaxID=2854389 RepID=UPI0028E408D1|nr:DEAD/DEAH box helicase [Bradyrhizobium prioritasuperba]